jgi:hypothetical protein
LGEAEKMRRGKGMEMSWGVRLREGKGEAAGCLERKVNQ